MEKKKIALFRGDFNPVHKGHIKVVKSILDFKKVDEVWILPIKQHQFDWELADSELRLEMLEMTFEGIKNVEICREELDFPGMSGVYEVLGRLKKKYSHEFIWLCGSDSLEEISRWYKRQEILETLKVIIFEREGFPKIEILGLNILHYFKTKSKNVSSKNIRFLKEEGESILRFVPKEIDDFIREKGLYLKVNLP